MTSPDELKHEAALAALICDWVHDEAFVCPVQLHDVEDAAVLMAHAAIEVLENMGRGQVQLIEALTHGDITLDDVEGLDI